MATADENACTWLFFRQPTVLPLPLRLYEEERDEGTVAEMKAPASVEENILLPTSPKSQVGDADEFFTRLPMSPECGGGGFLLASPECGDSPAFLPTTPECGGGRYRYRYGYEEDSITLSPQSQAWDENEDLFTSPLLPESGDDENRDAEGSLAGRPASMVVSTGNSLAGYIFLCSQETMPENLGRSLFGLPAEYADSVKLIKPGLPLFLYNYSTRQLHGPFMALSFGGFNIEPTAWQDFCFPGRSRFPAQVRVGRYAHFRPLEYATFRRCLRRSHGDKFGLELTLPEVVALTDLFRRQKPLQGREMLECIWGSDIPFVPTARPSLFLKYNCPSVSDNIFVLL